MRAKASFLAAMAIVLAGSAGLSSLAAAQPYGRGGGREVAERAHERNAARREERREERGGGYRQEYRAPPAYAYPPPQQQQPRAYAYPAPGYAYPERAPPPAYAAPPPQTYSYGPAPRMRQGALPLSSVTENLRRSVPGRMLDAWPENGPDGRPAYRVRWAAQGGRRIDFIVDAATGAIIGQSGY